MATITRIQRYIEDTDEWEDVSLDEYALWRMKVPEDYPTLSTKLRATY